MVELKYQLTETSKNFANVLADVEKSSHDIAEKHDQATATILKIEAELKANKVECEKLKAKNEQL